MNTRSQSLRNGALLQVVFGLVLVCVGPTMLGASDPFTTTAGSVLFDLGLVLVLAGLIFLGLSIMVRETVVPAQQPQPEPYYPPTA